MLPQELAVGSEAAVAGAEGVVPRCPAPPRLKLDLPPRLAVAAVAAASGCRRGGLDYSLCFLFLDTSVGNRQETDSRTVNTDVWGAVGWDIFVPYLFSI